MDQRQRAIRHANEFWDHYGVAVHAEVRSPGDLLFFSRNGAFPTHIGIVSGNGDTYIHAPGKDGSNVEEVEIALTDISTKDLGAKALYLVNPIGYKRPTLPSLNPTYRYHQYPV